MDNYSVDTHRRGTLPVDCGVMGLLWSVSRTSFLGMRLTSI